MGSFKAFLTTTMYTKSVLNFFCNFFFHFSTNTHIFLEYFSIANIIKRIAVQTSLVVVVSQKKVSIRRATCILFAMRVYSEQRVHKKVACAVSQRLKSSAQQRSKLEQSSMYEWLRPTNQPVIWCSLKYTWKTICCVTFYELRQELRSVMPVQDAILKPRTGTRYQTAAFLFCSVSATTSATRLTLQWSPMLQIVKSWVSVPVCHSICVQPMSIIGRVQTLAARAKAKAATKILNTYSY